jgi:IS1 family transposase
LDKKKAESITNFLDSVQMPSEDETPILELDELWSYVQKKSNKQWVWLALCRKTRQIVAFFVGDRSEKSCAALWENVPLAYKKGIIYTDFWDAYKKVLKDENHHACGKECGQTNHIERWNNTLRQRIGRFVRKTLSFSKSIEMHKLYLKLFIFNYNLSIKT